MVNVKFGWFCLLIIMAMPVFAEDSAKNTSDIEVKQDDSVETEPDVKGGGGFKVQRDTDILDAKKSQQKTAEHEEKQRLMLKAASETYLERLPQKKTKKSPAKK
jgi:hypothetical protein